MRSANINRENLVAEAIHYLYQELKQPGQPLSNAKKVADYLRLKYGFKPHEQFGILAVDVKLRLIEEIPLFRGTTDKASIFLKEIFIELLKCHAQGFIAWHNHPASSLEPPTPSEYDNAVTKRLVKAGVLLEIECLDHVIVSPGGYYSYAENNNL